MVPFWELYGGIYLFLYIIYYAAKVAVGYVCRNHNLTFHVFTVNGIGTHSRNIILECLLEENKDLSIYLAAPTGKATSRMRQSIVAMTQGPIACNFPRMKEVVSEETAQGAPRRVEEHTIHKWLVKKTPSGEKPSADNPLPADVLIIDEASMVDIHLAARLFEVVSESTRVIILGDKHQLAAVGPGAVFADIYATDGALAASTVDLKTSRKIGRASCRERVLLAV